MVRRGCLLVLLVTACAQAAEPWSVVIADADPVVRHGLIWRCRITGDIPTSRFDLEAYVAQVSLTQHGTTLAAQEFPLARLGQLMGGIDVVLVPTMPPQAEEAVELAVTVSDRSHRDLQHVARALPTPIGLQRGLERRQRMLAERKDADPLPALWLEQAGELVLGGTTIATCRQLLTIGDQLDRWLAGDHTATTWRALRDPIDGSVQPYRLHIPNDGALSTLVVLLADAATPLQKSAWPPVDDAWITAARSAGCAVVEVYPAGDTGWDGIARTRVWTTIAAAQASEQRLAALPLALVGSGRAAIGALAVAEEQPLRLRALGMIAPRLPLSAPLPAEPRQRWFALQRPGERPAHLLGLMVAMDGGDSGAHAWAQRLTLAGRPPVTAAGAASQGEFWRALTIAAPMPTQREWQVLAPATFGNLHVEEVADWGLAASLMQEHDGALRTYGIGRLRIDRASATTVDGRPYRAPGAAPVGPRKALGQALGPLSGYATAPFTVVVGTGESAAAQVDNRALAQAFAVAWAMHAQGRVRLVADTGLTEEALPGQNLVLIGNTRSNLLLAQLTARSELPVRWDSRAMTVGDQSFLRAQRRSVALAWPHPAHDGRLMVILDGRAAWREDGLPLAGLPDLVIGGEQAEDPPALQRTFSNDWR
jgi:hypothetical protein